MRCSSNGKEFPAKILDDALPRVRNLVSRVRAAIVEFLQPEDLYARAVRQGAVAENQSLGLGEVRLEPREGERTAATPGRIYYLCQTAEQYMWARSLGLDADKPEMILVRDIKFGGRQINVGSAGSPLSIFRTNTTRYGISFGRKFVMPGQTIQVGLENLDPTAEHTVTGGVVLDELGPTYGLSQKLTELLLRF